MATDIIFLPGKKKDTSLPCTRQSKASRREPWRLNSLTRSLAADAVSGFSYEARAKLGCHPSSISRMARRTRQAADKYPWFIPRWTAHSYLLRPPHWEDNNPIQESLRESGHSGTLPAFFHPVGLRITGEWRYTMLLLMCVRPLLDAAATSTLSSPSSNTFDSVSSWKILPSWQSAPSLVSFRLCILPLEKYRIETHQCGSTLPLWEPSPSFQWRR